MNERKNNPRAFFRNDIILISLLVLISAMVFVYLFLFRKGGNTVKVTVDGEIFGIYPLSENITEDIVTGKDGEGLNRFVISDGRVYMDKATCPDGICVAHRPVFRNGESIVCLPNRVVITVVSEDDTDSPDVSV